MGKIGGLPPLCDTVGGQHAHGSTEDWRARCAEYHHTGPPGASGVLCLETICASSQGSLIPRIGLDLRIETEIPILKVVFSDLGLPNAFFKLGRPVLIGGKDYPEIHAPHVPTQIPSAETNCCEGRGRGFAGVEEFQQNMDQAAISNQQQWTLARHATTKTRARTASTS